MPSTYFIHESIEAVVTIRALLAEASIRIGDLQKRFPEVRELESIRLQMLYLSDYAAGHNSGARLSEINLGLMTVREVEPRDEKLAELLYEVAEWLREQRGQTGWPK